MSSLNAKDRVSLCSFTFADGRRCRSPRTCNNSRFCFYHAQKEAQARAAQSLGKDLDYFFSGDYLSACDLSTALARLIPAVVRGDVKPKVARTVAYMAQTLLQSIHISQHEYCYAFGDDGWRKSIRNSVNGNHDYRFPPAPQPAQPESPTDQDPDVVAGLQTGAVHAPQPAAGSASVPAGHFSSAAPAQTPPSPSTAGATSPAQPQPQPVSPSPSVCHSSREESAVSSNSSLATHHSPLPQAPQSAPSPHTPLPPTRAEFVQRVLAGQMGGAQVPQPAAPPTQVPPPASHTTQPPANCHPARPACSGPVGERIDERPTASASPESYREEPASSPNSPLATTHSPAASQGEGPLPSAQPNNPPPTAPPTPPSGPNRDTPWWHFGDNRHIRPDSHLL